MVDQKRSVPEEPSGQAAGEQDGPDIVEVPPQLRATLEDFSKQILRLIQFAQHFGPKGSRLAMQSIVLTILKLLMIAGHDNADEIFKKWIDTAMAQIRAGKA